MDKEKSRVYYALIRTLGQLLAVLRLYKFEHPAVKKKFSLVFNKVSEFIETEKTLTFSKSANVFLVNGNELEAKDGLAKRFAEKFHDLQLASLELKPGLSAEEFAVFMHLLTESQDLKGEERVRKYLKEKGVKHVVPLFAVYKLVKDGEEVVEESKVIKTQDLPLEIIKAIKGRFSQDLKKGNVNERLQKEEKTYRSLAHDPAFLSQQAFDSVKEETNAAEIEKSLWAIGDYLIGEINNATTKKINSKILDEVKKQLITFLEKKPDKTYGKDNLEKAFTKINAAMALKSLILLYQKHKKEVEGVADKLKKILEDLPKESNLYQKTKEKLKEIGTPHLDTTLF